MGSIRSNIKRVLLSYKMRKKNVFLEHGTQLSVNCTFEGYNRVGNNTFFAGSMGYASYIGDDCHIVADIGRFTCIAPRVVTVRGTHPTSTWVSIHPVFFSKAGQCGMYFVNEDRYCETKAPVKIGNDVWIGDSAILMDGITIGDGVVIAAGAVVTKSVEPYAIVGGVPAKVIRYRFEEDEIKRLLAFKWWEQPPEWIRDNADRFSNVRKFLDGEESKKTCGGQNASM